VESTIVAGAMPTIVATLGDFEFFSWTFTAYLLMQAVSVPLYGRLADLYGRKRIFIVGAGLFAVGSVLCGFATRMPILASFRAVQGVGAGAILPLCMTILGDIYAPVQRAKIQGYVSVVWGVSAVAGPMIGAYLIAHVGWRAVFWASVPLCITSMILLKIALQENVGRQKHYIDYFGALLLVTGSGSLLLAIVQGSQLGEPMVILFSTVGIAALGALVVQERHTPEPLLPLDLWQNRVISAASIGSFVIGATMMATTAFLPAYVQGVMARSPVVAGGAVAALMLGWPIGNLASGWVMARSSYRFTVAVGGLVLLAGSCILAGLTPQRGPLWAGVGAAVTGVGMGLCNTTFLVATQASVDWGRRGIATSACLFMRAVGQSVGTALFGGILNAGLSGTIADAAAQVQLAMDPSRRMRLATPDLQTITETIAGLLHEVYVLAAVLSIAASVLAFRLPAGLGPAQQRGGR
jgi:EmrB/QacA subfamily drug resistance transporter